MSSHPDLAGKVVVVTGAGKGIGQAIAERFGTAGSSVVVNDVDDASAHAVANGIIDAGGTAMAAPTDVSDGEQVAAMFDTVMSAHGTVDVLVNNAGLVSPMLHFFDADEAWWRRIIDVNLTGHFL
ncbi:MAG TPA: short-chain dehydrogenase, partial [Acidimicrobiaceae bacterium]|nr:short-chain dehydrogenase [Acidimicrobiaceae bacterium]